MGANGSLEPGLIPLATKTKVAETLSKGVLPPTNMTQDLLGVGHCGRTYRRGRVPFGPHPALLICSYEITTHGAALLTPASVLF